MRILLTNDDGIHSPGLIAMRDALADVGDVLVVAPERNQSGVGRAISISADLRTSVRELPGSGTGFAVAGTPVDCVRMGYLGLVEGPIDAVVAGVNLGQNLGDDATYSGTVGAALEGVLLGVPSMGVSQRIGGIWNDDMSAETDFSPVAEFSAGLLSDLMDEGWPDGVGLSINGPRSGDDHPSGARLTRLTRCVYRDELEQVGEDADGLHYRIYGRAPHYLGGEGTDSEAIDAGAISVTPLRFALDAPADDLPPALGDAITARAPGGTA